MKCKYVNKIAAVIMCLIFTIAHNNLDILAIDWGAAYLVTNLIKEGLDYAKPLLSKAWSSGTNFVCNKSPLSNASICDDKNMEKNKGYKPAIKANELLEEISNGTSNIRVYGQEKAKSQCIPILMDSLNNIENIIKGNTESRQNGNVIYVIGASGTGKTTMVNAIGEAILKNPQKAMLTIDPSFINNRYSLGDQLFKTVGVKNIGKSDKDGLFEQEKEAPILNHLLKYDGEVVVFIDDFDKMKKLSNSDSSFTNQYENCVDGTCETIYGKNEDKTADEILKTIAATGEYTVGGTKIDCRKAIFFVATNEKRSDLEKNFGIDGSNGGGVQRLDIIEFENLKSEDCRRIVIDVINEIRTELTDISGNYKLSSFLVSDESINAMASIIESDKVNQGRLRKQLKRQILSLFTRNLGREAGLQYELSYKKVTSDPLHILNFIRKETNKQFYNIPSFHHDGNATIPHDGKDLPVVTDVASCNTCKSLLIYTPNSKSFNEKNAFTYGDSSKYILPFVKRLPKEIQSETLKSICKLLHRELNEKNYINKNCILITVNTKGNHQNYVTAKFMKKELLSKPEGDVWVIKY